MPVLPPDTINSIPKAERAEATRLLFERSMLQYRFSFEKLSEHMDVDAIRACIVAWTDKEERELKSDLNNQLTSVFTNNGIEKTLRYGDPFDRPKDYIMMEGTAVSFSATRALPLFVSGVFQWECPECETENWTVTKVNVHCANASCKHFRHSDEDLKDKKLKLKLAPLSKIKAIGVYQVPAEAVKAVFDAATERSKYVTFQARDVDEDGPRKTRSK